MNPLEAMRIALLSLWANKLRSVLTLLGMVIGVAAVIAVVTFTNGLNKYMAEKVFNLGADVIIINKSANVITNVEQWLEAQRRKDITYEDYEAVHDQCRSCKIVGASIGYFTGDVKYGDRDSEETGIRGWSPSMTRIYDLDLILGRPLTEADERAGSHVAMVGHDIYQNLLGPGDPLGKMIRVDGQEYAVIGVGKKEGSALGQSRDNWVAIPLTSWRRQYGSRRSVRVWIKSYGVGDDLERAVDDARVILRARRHDLPGQPDSFEADTNQTFLNLWANISSTVFLVVIILASISIIVGGIVIMNIMLMAVTERTREIGIRKALGARRDDVLAQFLLEAVTIAMVGGILGIGLGVAVAKTVSALVGMPAAVPAWAIGAAVTVAASVGIFFGVYPARRAARLDPIVALRFEL